MASKNAVRTLEAIYHDLDVFIRAAEDFPQSYRKGHDDFTKLMEAESTLASKTKAYLKGLPNRARAAIKWNSYEDKLKAVQAADDFDVEFNDNFFDNESSLFMQAAFGPIQDATSTGYVAGQKQYDIPAGNPMSNSVRLTVANHVADLVGMKYENGNWVDNPDSKFNINDTTRDKIRESIGRSLDAGASLDEAQSALDFLDDPDRAEMIARTESVRGYQGGLLQFGSDSGAVSKEWQTAGAEDEACLDPESDGAIDLDATFSGGLDAPPAHPNCRCGLVLNYADGGSSEDDNS